MRTVADALAPLGIHIAALPIVFAYLMPQPDAVRIALCVGLIAPLAFAMGMPFPRGVARLAECAPVLIPWAWGVNACASVVAAILAAVLAIHIGFDAVVVLGVHAAVPAMTPRNCVPPAWGRPAWYRTRLRASRYMALNRCA